MQGLSEPKAVTSTNTKRLSNMNTLVRRYKTNIYSNQLDVQSFFAKNCRWTFFVEICERGERWAFLGCQVLPCPRHQHGQRDQRLSIAGHSTRTNLTKDHSRRLLISCAISIRPNILTFGEAISVWKYNQEDASTVIKSIWCLFLQPMWQCAPGNLANFSFSALQFNFVLNFLTFTLIFYLKM